MARSGEVVDVVRVAEDQGVHAAVDAACRFEGPEPALWQIRGVRNSGCGGIRERCRIRAQLGAGGKYGHGEIG